MPRLDTYVWVARVAPAVIAAAPLLAFLAFVPASPIVGLLTSAIGVGVAVIAAAELTRTRGLSTEERLQRRRGGMPTTQALRSVGDDPAARARRRQAVETLSRLAMPNAREEARDPAESDRRIVHAVHLALARVRLGAIDSSLLAAENASYGFRRNSRGIKPIALIVLVLAAIGVLVVGALTSRWLVAWCVTALDFALIIYWTAAVRDDWVWQQAEKFSRQFFTVAEIAAEGGGQ